MSFCEPSRSFVDPLASFMEYNSVNGLAQQDLGGGIKRSVCSDEDEDEGLQRQKQKRRIIDETPLQNSTTGQQIVARVQEVSSFPKEFIQSSTNERKNAMQHLCEDSHSLDFSENIGSSNLKLSDNQITTFSESFDTLSLLQPIVLSNNQLTTLPNLEERLCRLTPLFIAKTQITTLPESFKNLSQLQREEKQLQGGFTGSSFITLPESFKTLSQLQREEKQLQGVFTGSSFI